MISLTNSPFVIALFDRKLTDITAISSYIHIRFLDVSSNHLTDLSPLSALTQLLWLKARGSLLCSPIKVHDWDCHHHCVYSVVNLKLLFFCRLTIIL